MKWQRVVQEKLFLAETLLRSTGGGDHQVEPSKVEVEPSKVQRTALVQGAVALILNARASLLVLIAQSNQNKVNEVVSLDALGQLLGENNPDIQSLRQLSQNRHSWWYQLEMLAAWLMHPREEPRAASEHDHGSNLIIAIADEGPATTPADLLGLIKEFKTYTAELSQRHDEW
ncbi:MAG: hypothetical protein CL583_08795 [Alteromonadaceae bacterium]|nr:hypothetical protein [Alteromonadaceae bacterium]